MKETELVNSAVVFYHGPTCMDGFCSAWIAHKVLGDKANYVPINYGDPIPNVEGKDVYILDFSFKPDTLREMIKSNNITVLLDHHKTSEADLQEFIQESENIKIRFDMNKSGAKMTQEYFMNTFKDPYLPIVDYVEDRDLWRFKLTDSKQVNAALRSYDMDFGIWDELALRSIESLAQEGAAILRDQEKTIDRLVKDNMFLINIDGIDIPCINSPVLQSEIAGRLASEHPSQIGCCTYYIGLKIRYSLRSVGPDVSAIAKKHGGGGHKLAAGFESDLMKGI